MKVVLSIAGSDSGGGAGIQADIKTAQYHGVFMTTAITALTAQNTLGVSEVVVLDPSFVKEQIRSAFLSVFIVVTVISLFLALIDAIMSVSLSSIMN